MLVVVTYKQRGVEEDWIEQTVTFATKWAFQKELERCEREGNPMIVTGMWCW